MSGLDSPEVTVRGRWRVAAGLACLFLGAFVWVAMRESSAEKEIKRLLVQLRAEGEPIDAQDLARLFPDPAPEEDAEVLFARAFQIASNRPAPGLTPLVMSGTVARTEAIDGSPLEQLIDFLAATAAITSAFPTNVPPTARFAMRWSRGMTNAAAVNLAKVRLFTQFLAAQIVAAAEVDNAERATVMMEQGFAFTGTVNYEGMLMTHMIRHACEGLMCAVTERALNRTRFTEAQLRRISGALRVETEDDLRNCLRVEHCFVIWAFQSVRDGMSVEALFGGAGSKSPWWQRIWNRMKRRRPDYSDADFLTYLRTIPLRLSLATIPPREAMGQVDKMNEEYTRTAWSAVGEGILPSAMGWGLGIHAEAQARMTSLLVVLAVERARLKQSGDLPQSLEALVPQYLSAVPPDPFDAQPLRFKRLPQGYVVYSIGRDGVDDGGIERSNSNATTNSDSTIIIER